MRKNAYQRRYDLRKRWLPLYGKVTVSVKFKNPSGSDESTTNVIGIGKGNTLKNNKNEAYERAVDDAIYKYVTSKRIEESFGQDYEQLTGSGKKEGSFNRKKVVKENSVRIINVKIIGVRYPTKTGEYLKTFSRGGKQYTGLFKKGQRGYVSAFRHDKASRVDSKERDFDNY